MAQTWINGKMDAKLDPSDRAFAYGDGVFVTMAVDSQGQVRFLESYLQRLQESTARLGFCWRASADLLALIDSIAQAHPLHCLKLLVSRGVGGRGYAAPAAPTPNEVLSVSQLPAQYAAWRAHGVSLALSSVTLAAQPLLAGIKHCNRLEQVLIKSQSLPNGTDDWLVLDQQQQIIEASMANLVLLFSMAEKLIAVSPSHAQSGVSGVMRQQLILQLIELGIDVELRPVSLTELKRAKHLLLCNSLIGVVDVVCADGVHFERWNATASLQQTLVPQ
ncbi:aminodeoxychorismate lyase [Shewanella avicenniae]|uniref:Aminodeoxychorismate lyase n=1 Tax=Shewanella avicenniae TaxID=2814294 RepID=A0ABX7QL47_9GAMM|nr:aminodeoxychorismate lyase [Shewanella avicenniae]QSX32177.1 aminodeoxychorismate lyase [Shewanella avicenniae]